LPIHRLDGDAAARRAPAAPAFLVFVEGPRDGDILRCWARLDSPLLARRLAGAISILGGRRPARAVAQLRSLAAAGTPAWGLCVLDGDGSAQGEADGDDVSLELFTWRRRHIESYLLVPDAIRRGARVRDHDGHFARRLRAHLPPLDDESALRQLDAKRLLDRRGPLARLVGRPIEPSRIARAMRREELHPDVLALLARLAAGLGLARSGNVATVWREGAGPR
jgi:hypothetical protein